MHLCYGFNALKSCAAERSDDHTLQLGLWAQLCHGLRLWQSSV